MENIRISAKDIAEFLHGSGNLTQQRTLFARAREGTAIHLDWQQAYEGEYATEVFVKTAYTKDDITLEITGRIDGLLFMPDKIILEEIKSTYRDLDALDKDTVPAHMVQAKLYAYMYMIEKDIEKLMVRLTYVHVEDQKHVSFDVPLSLEQAEIFFMDTIDAYIDWLRRLNHHEKEREKSIEGLVFPFDEYRLGQRELMAYNYKNILAGDILYAEAPTGIGKTVATLFSSLKAINQPRQKVFFLTAKNDGKVIAIETIRIMQEHGLIAKTCEITAKDRMCLLDERDCDPEVCPYAKAYYEKVYDAIVDLYDQESLYTKDVIKAHAKKHEICPFEFSLDLSNYADVVIADYNYAFDPGVRLIRYFDEETYAPILLVDEAHNLVPRSRDMFSKTLPESLFGKLMEYASYVKPSMKKHVQRILDDYAGFRLALSEVDFLRQNELNTIFVRHLSLLVTRMDNIINQHKKIPFKSEIMDAYFEVAKFIRASEYFDDDFVFLLEEDDDDIFVSVKCLDASRHIAKIIEKRILSVTFFSATFNPIHYHRRLLTRGKGKFVRFPSSFPKDNLGLYIIDDVSTRYHDREASIPKIVSIAKELIASKTGNYILFFPSYRYLNRVKKKLDMDDDVTVITQKRDMSLKSREETLMLFRPEQLKTHVGLFVMGGIFSESIDLIGDRLSGVMVIGAGLPGLSPYNKILRSHFEAMGEPGFDFAFTYPGLNKVIQAVGRLIRTKDDRGIAVLVDDRFATRKYLGLYPRHWHHLELRSSDEDLFKTFNEFWELP